MPERTPHKQYRQSRQSGIAMCSGSKQLSQTSELRTCPYSQLEKSRLEVVGFPLSFDTDSDGSVDDRVVQSVVVRASGSRDTGIQTRQFRRQVFAGLKNDDKIDHSTFNCRIVLSNRKQIARSNLGCRSARIKAVSGRLYKT